MGIGGERHFSNDVLKIEISGPSRSQFSITDVPGIFQSLTKGLTESEMCGVKQVIQEYIRPQEHIVM